MKVILGFFLPLVLGASLSGGEKILRKEGDSLYIHDTVEMTAPFLLSAAYNMDARTSPGGSYVALRYAEECDYYEIFIMHHVRDNKYETIEYDFTEAIWQIYRIWHRRAPTESYPDHAYVSIVGWQTDSILVVKVSGRDSRSRTTVKEQRFRIDIPARRISPVR